MTCLTQMMVIQWNEMLRIQIMSGSCVSMHYKTSTIFRCPEQGKICHSGTAAFQSKSDEYQEGNFCYTNVARALNKLPNANVSCPSFFQRRNRNNAGRSCWPTQKTQKRPFVKRLTWNWASLCLGLKVIYLFNFTFFSSDGLIMASNAAHSDLRMLHLCL